MKQILKMGWILLFFMGASYVYGSKPLSISVEKPGIGEYHPPKQSGSCTSDPKPIKERAECVKKAGGKKIFKSFYIKRESLNMDYKTDSSISGDSFTSSTISSIKSSSRKSSKKPLKDITEPVGTKGCYSDGFFIDFCELYETESTETRNKDGYSVGSASEKLVMSHYEKVERSVCWDSSKSKSRIKPKPKGDACEIALKREVAKLKGYSCKHGPPLPPIEQPPAGTIGIIKSKSSTGQR